MNKRSKEFFKKRKAAQLQNAWDMVSDYVIETSVNSHTHFVSIVETGYYGRVALSNLDIKGKLVSTKQYK